MCVVATLPLPSLSSLHSARKLHFFIINRENPRYLHKTVATGGTYYAHFSRNQYIGLGPEPKLADTF